MRYLSGEVDTARGVLHLLVSGQAAMLRAEARLQRILKQKKKHFGEQQSSIQLKSWIHTIT